MPVPKTEKDPAAKGPCPEGTALVRARDVIGPTPAGFEVLPGDKQRLASVAAQFREGFGDKWRGYDAKVLVRRDAANGAAVVVVNLHEKVGSDEEYRESAMAAERASGAEGRPIQIAGREGRLRTAPDGAFVATAPAGTCALVAVMADTGKLLLDAVEVMRPR